MNKLTVMNFNGIETVDSRQVAEATGKAHKNLLQDIRTYCGYLGELNFQPTDFFIESTYTTEQNKTMPCYLCTRKGCEMIANKMTGKKGVAFTALYINAFHAMEQKIAKHYTELQALEIQARADRAAAMRMNAENRRLKMLLDHPNIKELSPESLAALGISKMQEATGQDLRHVLVKPMKAEQEVLDVLEYLQMPETGYICTTEEMTVLQFMQSNGLQRYDARNIGKVLKKYGYESKKKKISGKVIRVIELPTKTPNYKGGKGENGFYPVAGKDY